MIQDVNKCVAKILKVYYNIKAFLWSLSAVLRHLLYTKDNCFYYKKGVFT